MVHGKRLVPCLAHSVHLGKAGPLLITVLAKAPADPRPVLDGRRGPWPWPRAHSSSLASPPSHAHSPGQRTDEELDLIFEELLHIKAVAHLSNSVSLQGPVLPLPQEPPLPLTSQRTPPPLGQETLSSLPPMAWKFPSNLLPLASLSGNCSASLSPFPPTQSQAI